MRFADLHPDFMYRMPGRDHRVEVTHKKPSEMNRKERRAVEKDMQRHPENYAIPSSEPGRE